MQKNKLFRCMFPRKKSGKVSFLLLPKSNIVVLLKNTYEQQQQQQAKQQQLKREPFFPVDHLLLFLFSLSFFLQLYTNICHGETAAKHTVPSSMQCVQRLQDTHIKRLQCV